MGVRIKAVAVATVQGQLPAPVVFGDWVMAYREYAVVRVTTEDGVEGWSFGLTRDGAVADQIRRSIVGIYVGSELDARERTYATAWRRSLASHASGVGLRALSLVDLAAWDAAARHRDLSITELLAGRAQSMPATAIVGYPPAEMGPQEIRDQVAGLYAEGWRRFKAPVAATPGLSAARLRAARAAAPDAWLGCDAAWIYEDVEDAVEFATSIEDVGLGWFEDVFPPGDSHKLAQLRSRVPMQIAMGDEQGGSYYPQALLDVEAVDVVRIDLTCMGGITGTRRIVDECVARGVAFAPHMFAHVHSRVFSAWGYPDSPIEWGVPWTGVDPYADSLEQVALTDEGRMLPLREDAGFGELVARDWIAAQPFDDPQQILGI